jgi:hypothetical protein
VVGADEGGGEEEEVVGGGGERRGVVVEFLLVHGSQSLAVVLDLHLHGRHHTGRGAEETKMMKRRRVGRGDPPGHLDWAGLGLRATKK